MKKTKKQKIVETLVIGSMVYGVYWLFNSLRKGIDLDV